MIEDILSFETSNLNKIRKYILSASVLDDLQVFHYLVWHLSTLECASVAVEKGYVDKDFSEDYSCFYSGVFSDEQKYCTRLHFFKNLNPEYLEKIIGSKKNRRDIAKVQKKLTDCYLGFVVVLPIQKGKIGRTFLRPKDCEDSQIFLTSVSKQKVHIDGVSLEVHGVPFIHQDGQVAVCSSSAMWMVARFLHLENGYKRYSLSNITREANRFFRRNREFPAVHGLTVEQIISGLIEMGFTPYHYEKIAYEEQWDPKELIYRYIESGFPVIAIVGGGASAHACVVVGHDYCYKKSIYKKGKFLSTSNFINSFVVNDDLIGPYLLLPQIQKITSATHKITVERDFEDLKSDSLTFTPYSMQSISSVIAPVPRKIYLESTGLENLFGYIFPVESQDQHPFYLKTYHDALCTIYTLFERGVDLLSKSVFMKALNFYENMISPEKRIFFRTRFVKSVDLKQDYFLNKRKVSEKLGRLYSDLHMPRYVWLVEIFHDKSVLPGRELKFDQVAGEIIFDATGTDSEVSILAVHFPGALMLRPDLYPRYGAHGELNFSDPNDNFEASGQVSFKSHELKKIGHILNNPIDENIDELKDGDEDGQQEEMDTIVIPIADTRPYEHFDRDRRCVKNFFTDL